MAFSEYDMPNSFQQIFELIQQH